MNTFENHRRSLTRAVGLVLCVGLLSVQLLALGQAQSRQPSSPTPKKITITGFISPCYKSNK